MKKALKPNDLPEHLPEHLPEQIVKPKRKTHSSGGAEILKELDSRFEQCSATIKQLTNDLFPIIEYTRVLNRLTQYQMAHLLNISTALYSRRVNNYAAGKDDAFFSAETLLHFCVVFGYDLGPLMKSERESPVSPDARCNINALHLLGSVSEDERINFFERVASSSTESREARKYAKMALEDCNKK